MMQYDPPSHGGKMQFRARSSVLAFFGLALCACHSTGSDAAPADVTRVGTPQKIFQLIGDDHESPPPAQLETPNSLTYGIAGADLGFPVTMGQKTLFFFADVVGETDAVTQQYADALGWTTSLSPAPFSITFSPPASGSTLPFLPIAISNTTRGVPPTILGANDGPSSAFVYEGKLFGFFRVGASPTAIDPVTGQLANGRTGLLAVSTDEGLTFDARFDLPQIMVGTQPVVVDTATIPDLGWSTPQTLLVWGHNAGAPVLAAAPLDTPDDPTWISRWVYRTKDDGWSSNPSDAYGVFSDDMCLGNFSVTYLPDLARWIMLTTCTPKSLQFRVAALPLGSWSTPQTWFDPVADKAVCVFMHSACSADGSGCCDMDITGLFPGGALTNGGFPYGPYILPSLSTWDAASATETVYSLMSTGNPYTSVLMQTQLHGQ
jgi:hypothetical protein